jgi:hypothetical protein
MPNAPLRVCPLRQYPRNGPTKPQLDPWASHPFSQFSERCSSPVTKPPPPGPPVSALGHMDAGSTYPSLPTRPTSARASVSGRTLPVPPHGFGLTGDPALASAFALQPPPSPSFRARCYPSAHSRPASPLLGPSLVPHRFSSASEVKLAMPPPRNRISNMAHPLTTFQTAPSSASLSFHCKTPLASVIPILAF